jgi:hypothetical protein
MIEDALREILHESSKHAGDKRYGRNIMAKLERDEVSLKAYVLWLESQPAEMLDKTYHLLMTGWDARREGLADVTTLFRDASGYVARNGPRAVKKAPCCETPEFVKRETGGRMCRSCGKKWKPKKAKA